MLRTKSMLNTLVLCGLIASLASGCFRTQPVPPTEQPVGNQTTNVEQAQPEATQPTRETTTTTESEKPGPGQEKVTMEQTTKKTEQKAQ